MLVDLENHPAMFLGGVSYAYGNSPVAIESEKSFNQFKVALSAYDSGVIPRQDLSEGLKVIIFSKFMNDSGRSPAMRSRVGLKKSFAFNVRHLEHFDPRSSESFWHTKPIGGHYTLAIRAFNPQAGVYALQIELLQARARYLRNKFTKEGKLIPYLEKILSTEGVLKRFGEREDRVGSVNVAVSPGVSRSLPQLINPQQSADEFYSYVTESGLDWQRFRVLLDPRVQKLVPIPMKRELQGYIQEWMREYCQKITIQGFEDRKCRANLDSFSPRVQAGACSQTGAGVLGSSELQLMGAYQKIAQRTERDQAMTKERLQEEVKKRIRAFCESKSIPVVQCKDIVKDLSTQ